MISKRDKNFIGYIFFKGGGGLLELMIFLCANLVSLVTVYWISGKLK